jgi:hypothetical protein
VTTRLGNDHVSCNTVNVSIRVQHDPRVETALVRRGNDESAKKMINVYATETAMKLKRLPVLVVVRRPEWQTRQRPELFLLHDLQYIRTVDRVFVYIHRPAVDLHRE